MNVGRNVLITQRSRIITSVLVLICFLTAARVVSTYRVFSQTYDEGAHVGAGLEWLTVGTYTKEQQHPPLQRVAVAVGPYLAGARFNPAVDLSMNGIDAFHMDGRYSTILSFARAGTLPFLIGSILLVFAWAATLFGREVGLISAGIYSLLQPVLAHGGLATTDMALAATVPAAIFSFDRLLRNPSIKFAMFTGVATAAALVSKLSSLIFLTAGFVAVLICWWLDRKRLTRLLPLHSAARLILIVVVGAFLTVWAVYRFSIGSVLPPNMPWKFNSLASSPAGIERIQRFGYIPIPAPELVGGIGELLAHNKMGHWSYLMGERKEGGWWYYFPIAFALKTPIPFLILIGIACTVVARLSHSAAPLVPVFAAGGVLLASMPSKINIGIRHVLPMYPLLAVVSGAAVVWLWRRARFRDLSRTAAILLAGWLVIGSANTHPDYLPYFNAFAGKNPAYWLLDSNLDWGQDFLRLKREVHKRRIDSLMLSYFGTAIPQRHNFPALREVDFGNPRPGWFAVSEQHVYAFPWLQYFEPIVRPGPSIRLYYIPEVKLN